MKSTEPRRLSGASELINIAVKAGKLAYQASREPEEYIMAGRMNRLAQFQFSDLTDEKSPTSLKRMLFLRRRATILLPIAREVSCCSRSPSRRYLTDSGKYFEGHPILFRDVELSLAQTIKTIEDAITTFNEYLNSRADLFRQEWDREEREGEEDRRASLMSPVPGEREGHLVLSIEAIQYRVNYFVDEITDEWLKNAKHKAVADILQETQEHEAYVWQSFRERVEVKA
jgi:hypothetical protein